MVSLKHPEIGKNTINVKAKPNLLMCLNLAHTQKKGLKSFPLRQFGVLGTYELKLGSTLSSWPWSRNYILIEYLKHRSNRTKSILRAALTGQISL